MNRASGVAEGHDCRLEFRNRESNRPVKCEGTVEMRDGRLLVIEADDGGTFTLDADSGHVAVGESIANAGIGYNGKVFRR